MSQELMTQSPPAVVDEGGISQLVRLAEQGVAVEVLERLVALQEKVSDRNVRMAFVQAMAAFQAEVPPIPKTGEIPDNNGNVRSRFAPLPVIAETIRAPLANHGLSYSWSSVDDDGFVEVTCTVRHVHGHSESASFKCRTTDAAAPKMSGVQMSGSARSYGMRYSLIQALGLTTADEDNDGEGAGVQEVSLRQAEEIDRLLQETGADRTKFFEWAGVKSISEIAAKDFAGVVRALEQKGARR